ncbi:hypothetical protein [Thiofilum flexile]|uniref:hypothetical protein n=1 Tax=Thiofilum flexile TaxID=125627 RepID=UPI00036F6532|nr:hypothetical protein [Thiofilum flexile]
MKKYLLVALMLGTTTLVACGGSSDAPKAPETKPAASAPAPTPAASTPAPTPAPAAAVQAPTPAPVAAPAAATGPLADLIKSACACTAPECGTKAMGDLVALATSGTAIDLQGPDVAQLSQCIMATGIDKNEFISKMRQLRQ